MKMAKYIKSDPWLESYGPIISQRNQRFNLKLSALKKNNSLIDFANGHLYYGLHKTSDAWVFREWAPNATRIYLVGEFNNWEEKKSFCFNSLESGNWELSIPLEAIHHKQLYKLSIKWEGDHAFRISPWSTYVVQDEKSKNFNACIWHPENSYRWENNFLESNNTPPMVYEAHVGMATEELKTGSYEEFRLKVLPLIKKSGYTTLQLMAVQEHPYYGSFGYHVSNFFAPSSRFGTPDELKALIDEAHGMGIRVIMDLIHSHAVKNELEGPGNFDGSPHQFFHTGERREHVAWDSLCFNYGKDEVIHFLLSNIKYWLTEFRFDGFRFDGITSMLYLDHGLNRDFTTYDMYFDNNQDEDAITYLQLANNLCHEINPQSITIAEEMSAYPGLACSLEEGGLGFDYRMSMGTPDYWIKIIKEKRDEDWDVEEMFYELCRKRPEEKTLGYSESHDQALVGDKTIIFRLLDKEMYYSMSKDKENLVVDRGIALHKMIRLITMATSGNAYLNFMGNEFGHPEWIDFPRQGNNWSFQHARRQWSLNKDKNLKYHFLNDFDRAMISLGKDSSLLEATEIIKKHANTTDHVIAFTRANLLFVFNFHPEQSFTNYGIPCSSGKYKIILNTDNHEFGGQSRVDESILYNSLPERKYNPDQILNLYLPSRTSIVLQKLNSKKVH